MAASATPAAKSQLIPARQAEDDGATVEAQLDDGRWLQINERRTKDGGFVSVGTDITHDQVARGKLIDPSAA